MAELLIRAGSRDAALLDRVLDGSAGPLARWTPQRIVIDAHVATTAPQFAATAGRAGMPC